MSVLVFISSGMRSTAEIPDQRRSWSRYGGCEQGGGGALARKDEGGWRRRQKGSEFKRLDFSSIFYSLISNLFDIHYLLRCADMIYFHLPVITW